jgi:uncharacterized cupin superfamily protein
LPKLDLDAIAQTSATGYPPEYAACVAGRHYRRIAPVAGFTHFGASHVVLDPGACSALRHWHDGEDEMVVMVAGTATLIDDAGAHPMGPGDIAVFPAGDRNGHHLRNDGTQPCTFVAIGAGPRTGGGYSDIDMIFTADGRYLRRDGSDYGASRV